VVKVRGKVVRVLELTEVIRHDEHGDMCEEAVAEYV
jgi:hypothetical protein